MTSISPSVPLTLGIIAGVLFAAAFLFALIATMRSRKTIRRFADPDR